MKKQQIKQISLYALFTAFIAASAWVSIPTPFGVNLTMQLFAVCLAAFLLGAKGAVAATATYLIIGAVGLPVFSSFSGGIGVLFGASGGFLWGFLAVAIICGISAKFDKKAIKYLLCALAVFVCHIFGVIQYTAISGINVWAAIISVSLPFLLKDLIVAFLSLFTAKKLNKAIKG